MKIAYETIAASATAPGAGGAAMAAVTGDSLRIRDAKSAQIVDMGALRQASGRTRLTSPLLHDNTVGLMYPSAIDSRWLRMPLPQELAPQDTLSLNATGSAVAGDVELFWATVRYEEIGGIDGRFTNKENVRKKAVEFYMPELTIVTTGAGWTGSVTLASANDAWKANKDYAIIGIVPREAQANIAGIGLVGPDWGNLRIMVPYDQVQAEACGRYFWDIMDDDAIPVVNASQRSNVTLTGLGNENAATVVFALVTVRIER